MSGTKTWNIEGNTIPANPILKLTRTTTANTTPEIVTVKQGETYVNLQPEWSGEGKTITFVYTGLPKYDAAGLEYTYSVAEASFTIGTGEDAVTYTVVKNSNGTYTVTPDKEGATVYVTTQTGNNITNGLLETEIEIIKVEFFTWE